MKWMIYLFFNQIFFRFTKVLQISVGDIAIVFGGVALCCRIIGRKGAVVFNIDKRYLFLLILLNFMFLLSILHAFDYVITVKKLFQLFLYTILLYLIVSDFCYNSNVIKRLKNALISAAVFVSVLGVAQEIILIMGHADPLSFLSGLTFFQAKLSTENMGLAYGRVSSLFGNPNAFAMALIIPCAIVIEKLYSEKRVLTLFQLFCLVGGIVVSGSRTVMVSFFLILGLFIFYKVFLNKGTITKKVKNIVLLVTVIAILALPFEGFIFARLGALVGLAKPTPAMVVSEQHRFALWRFGFHLWKQRPIFGIGLGNFAPMSKGFFKYGIYEDNLTGWMNILVETGLCGLMAFLLLLFNVLKNGKGNALFIGIMVFSIANIVQDHFFLAGTGPIFWFSCHLLVCEKRLRWSKQ